MQEGETTKRAEWKRRMIKRVTEFGKPKVWCPREDYHLPQDGISMSVTSAFPSSNSKKDEIAIYRGTGSKKREDDEKFVLPSKVIDEKCHRRLRGNSVPERATHPGAVEIVICGQHGDLARLSRVGEGNIANETGHAAKGHAMPAGTGASYRSLGDLGEDVYKSTTIADQTQTTGQSVFESVKKAFSFASPKAETRKKDPLIDDRCESVLIVSRERNKMPTAATAEESALLGTMPSDSMDDIELKNIQLQFPALRYLSRDDSSVREERVETDKGSLLVAVQGNRAKPAILTYHDLGLNYISSFQAFFNYIDMRVLLENFCVYHVNAPGQEEGASTLPEDYTYPSMEELAEQLLFVLSHFAIKSVIGFGVGAGANILARFAFAHPEKVNALCLINCVSTQAGWIEWGYQKLNVRHLRSQGMTQGVLDYLMWHHFGRGTEERNHDLVQVYKNYFERRVNPTNLALFIDSYVRRTDLNITRELDPMRKKEGLTLSVPVMNITGALSPHVDDTVTLNGRLDPTNSSWMKISDCGMVLEEQPGKVSEAFRLFLQGEGYVVRSPRKPVKPTTPEVAPLSPLKMADYRLASLEGLNHVCSKKIDWPTATIHITENPISEAVVC